MPREDNPESDALIAVERETAWSVGRRVARVDGRLHYATDTRDLRDPVGAELSSCAHDSSNRGQGRKRVKWRYSGRTIRGICR